MLSSVSVSNRLSVTQWRVLWLLVFSVCINYIDRGTLSVAAPQITSEMKLTPIEMGVPAFRVLLDLRGLPGHRRLAG